MTINILKILAIVLSLLFIIFFFIEFILKPNDLNYDIDYCDLDNTLICAINNDSNKLEVVNCNIKRENIIDLFNHRRNNLGSGVNLGYYSNFKVKNFTIRNDILILEIYEFDERYIDEFIELLAISYILNDIKGFNIIVNGKDIDISYEIYYEKSINLLNE